MEQFESGSWMASSLFLFFVLERINRRAKQRKAKTPSVHVIRNVNSLLKKAVCFISLIILFDYIVGG